MKNHTLSEGDVFFLDLTKHIGVSRNTMKNPHYIAVIMNPRKLENNNHKTIVCVPMTSVQAQLWDETCNRPRIQSHHHITPEKYSELTNNTLVKCEQIYTI